MPAQDAIVVRGLADLNRAFAKADRDTRLGMRQELRRIGEPIAKDAEQLAGQAIRNIGQDWSRMRVGVTQKLVYVAPKQRGSKGRGGRHRPNLAGLLMDKAMQPALERNKAKAERETEEMLDRVCDRFNKG